MTAEEIKAEARNAAEKALKARNAAEKALKASNAKTVFEIWWRGEVIDEFDNEQTAKDSIKDYAMAFRTSPGAFTIKKVNR